MNNSFISNVVKYILNEAADLNDLCVIVPNRRVGVFFKRELALQIKKTSFYPEILPIKEIFSENTKLNEAENIVLLFNLYKSFNKYTDRFKDFDDFFFWGEIILNDFDYIDKYLIDHKKLFANVAEIKEIDSIFDSYAPEEVEIIQKFWQHIDQAKLSNQKKSFLELWKAMDSIFVDLKKSLKEQNIAYPGMIYREIAENISTLKFDKKTYAFVGFNALNKCEHAVFEFLKKNKTSLFFWDADQYYIDDAIQEAGLFIRENAKKYPAPKGFYFDDNIKDKQSLIDVIVAPSETAQVKLVPEILNEWKHAKGFDYENTAVILADENLLIPLLYSLPQEIQDYNISMGYPIKGSAAYSFINAVFKLQLDIKSIEEKPFFHFKSVLNILNHAITNSIFGEDCIKLKNNIIKNNNLLLDEDFYKTILNNDNEFFSVLFKFSNDSINTAADYLSKVVSTTISELYKKEVLRLELEFLQQISKNLNLLYDTFSKNKIDFESLKIYFRIVNNSLQNLNVPFEGEPLKGLQILGFLETRAIDFDRLIILSMNEGHFPKKSAPQSIIPYNIRKFYGLPSIEYQDSIYAYYFYRLLQKAKQIKIIYSAQALDGQGEASRFISQLDYELKNVNTHHKSYLISSSKKNKITVQKTDDILKKIVQHLEKGISPSAINSFLDCSLKYYFKYIANLAPADTLEEKDDAAYFGSVFHEAMSIIYSDFTGKIVSIEDIKSKLNDIEISKAILKAVAIVLQIPEKDAVRFHSDSLLTEVIHKYVNNLIKVDAKHAPFKIIGLETNKERTFKLDLDSQNSVNIKIKGIIDRIDFKNNIYRVLDYKTGKVTNKISSIDDLFVNDRRPELNGVTQTLVYAMMFRDKPDMLVCPGLISINELLTNPHSNLIIQKQNIDYVDDKIMTEFQNNIMQSFKNLLDSNHWFLQTENEKSCSFCDYKKICKKT